MANMATNPPSGRTAQRSLAAIVFTDAVSFSARVQRDEVGTLALLDRDFAIMRQLCAEHEGEVLKTTGDGLLLTFVSAVRAVACALAMQRRLAEAGKEEPAGEPLQHRIGIHLGDVLVNENDVMGDGVNIAARLQAEAAPGGICISQTVYDVVKNKIELQVVCLGPRDLKNISQSIPVYRLLLEAEAIADKLAPPKSSSTRKRVPRGAFIAAGVVAVFSIVVAVAAVSKRRDHRVAERAPVDTTASTEEPVANATPAPRAPEEIALEAEFNRRRDVINQLRTAYLDKYDFAGLARALRESGAKGGPRLGALANSADQMVTMKAWLDETVRRYSSRSLMDVRNLDGANHGAGFFLGWDRGLILVEGRRTTHYEWAQLPPAVVGSIIVSAIQQAKPSAPRDVFLGAQAFSRFYALPEMQQALSLRRGKAE
jgi:class 3 adenylate cyclase